MACDTDPGLLRAYLDNELPPAQRQSIETHLRECVLCSALLTELRADADLAGRALALPAEAQPAPEMQALAQLRVVTTAGRRSNATMRRHTLIQSIRSFLFGNSTRISVTATAAVAILILALVLTPLGSAADGLLGVFRVQKFATVSVDPATLPNSKTLEKLRKPDAFGKVETNPKPEIKKVDSYAQAQTQAGFTPVQPAGNSLPAGFKTAPELLYVSTAGTAIYKPDYDNLRAALDALGGTNVILPAALRGSTITYQFSPAVAAIYSNQVITDTKLNPGQHVIGVFQTPSPVVTTPDGVDLNKLRDEIVKIPNLPADLVTQLSQIQDLNTTVVIPVPKGQATSTSVKLHPNDANEAIVITSVNNDATLVIWETNNTIYVVGGNLPATDVVNVAKNLH